MFLSLKRSSPLALVISRAQTKTLVCVFGGVLGVGSSCEIWGLLIN